jgi:copper resistance protein C
MFRTKGVTMIFRRTVSTLLVAAAALLATATPALAHTSLKSSNPAEGATLATAPQQIQLTFLEAVKLPADPVTVTGPDGTKWGAGQATAVDETVTVPVQPAGPAGQYTITWHVISDDGDTVSGTIHFTLTAAASTPTSSAAPTTSTTTTTTASQAPTGAAVAPTSASGGGFPVWAWIALAVVILAASTVALTVRSRRRTPPGNN